MNNKEIAKQFNMLGKLMDIYGENPFKARSYSTAAFNIKQLPQGLNDLSKDELFRIPGIGAAIGNKILEMRTTGSMHVLDELITKTPPGILELAGIKGIGAKKIHDIWFKLGVEDPVELLYACNENRLIHLPGFGKKTQENIKTAIEFYLLQKGSYLFKQAEEIAMELEKEFREKINSPIEITGSLRRHEETISQLEFIIAGNAKDISRNLSGVKNITPERKETEKLIYKNTDGLKIIIYPSEQNLFANKLFMTTGSDDFIRSFCRDHPDIAGTFYQDEQEIFSKAGMQFIPPCLRESSEIIKIARSQAIPEIIVPADIKGLIHCHSTWSDGNASIASMAQGCIERGLEYMVISDHSKAAFYAQGLTEQQVMKQHQEIEMLNKKLSPFRIFKSIECDILADGNLDYDQDLLATFDLVIASIHSNIKMPGEKANQRLLKAISNPYLTILGHMTGRLLLSREGYEVDFEKIIDACAERNVVIELNANPRRLDIRWQWIPYALKKNVLISVNPDAHSVEEIDNNRYGVLAAQKAMVTKHQNLSSFSLGQFESFLARTHKKK